MPVPENFVSTMHLSAKERTFLQLQQWIIDGTLQPGEKLNDNELAQSLSVSRTPVREALQLLEVQGFVEFHPGRETRVTMIEQADISKILPPVAALQSLASELACPLIKNEHIVLLRTANAKFALAIDKGDAFRALKLDEHFHSIILEITKNPYLASMVLMLQGHVRRLFFLNSIVLTQESVQEHESLLIALERKDKNAANQITRENWTRPMKLYYEQI